MYARGATPLRSSTAGWQPPEASEHPCGREPAGTSVFAAPAMIPATNVPWNDWSRSSGELFAPGPAKPRATMTFGVVDPLGPLGEPGGYDRPVGSGNGGSGCPPPAA